MKNISVWWVFPIVGLIALVILLATGRISEGALLGLLLLLTVGAIYPPFGVGFGGAIAVYLVFNHFPALVSWWNGLLNRNSTPGAFAPLGPTLPGYQYNSATGTYGVLGKSV